MKTTTPDPSLVEATKGLRFTKNYDPVMDCMDLDAIEKLILAEVLHYRASGLLFYMSMDQLRLRIGTSRSTLKNRMRALERKGYLQITVSRRNFNQANVVEVGPATYALLTGTAVTRSREEDMMSSLDEPFLPPTTNAGRPLRTSVTSSGASKGQSQARRSTRPTWPVEKVVSSAEEKLPEHLFKMLTYHPSKGRELTETDAVKVFAWHGLPNEQAWDWWDARTKAGWPPTFDRLELCRTKAAKLAAEQNRSMEPLDDLFRESSPEGEPPDDFFNTPWPEEEPPYPDPDDPWEHINV